MRRSAQKALPPAATTAITDAATLQARDRSSSRPDGCRVRFPASRDGPSASHHRGAFDLASAAGGRLTSKELLGKPFAIFFGFTYCPDICPTTLLDLSTVIKDLGPDADRMRFLFVSIDPLRDTPEQLRKYLSSFDPRIIGLTGTETEIAAVAKAYRAYYAKVPTSDGYTMNHSTITYLMDANGQLADLINYQEDQGKQVAKLRRLLRTK